MKQTIRSAACAVGMLLIALQLTGCSAEKPAGGPADDPLTERAASLPPEQATSPGTAGTATSPGTAAAELSQPPTPATADPAMPAPADPSRLPTRQKLAEPTAESRSLQASLDQEPPPLDGDAMLSQLGYVSPAEKVRAVLADPPGATRISRQSSLWVDLKTKRVFADGYVAQREAYLEMFACPAETKEHESIVGVLAKSSELHAALLAVGAQQGTPVRFDTEYIPATGQRIRIWVMWYDDKGEFQHTDARHWVRHVGREDSLQLDWVFAGSSFWKDPNDGKEYYQAEGGEMICVSNFSTALLDLPVESSDANSELQFEAYTQRIPPPGTPVRLMLIPIPESAEAPAPNAAEQPPTAELMPLKEPAPPAEVSTPGAAQR